MKKSKIIIPALAMLVMSSAAAVTGTVAWFTMNKTAKADGMVVAAKTSGSLIVKEAAALSPQLPTASDRGTKVTFTDGAQAFYPSTHDDTTTNTTRLKYVSNGFNVNFETGTRMNGINSVADNSSTPDVDETVVGTELTYENVTADDTNYYFDYGLFLAGDGLAMSNQTLTITLDNDALNNLNGALSVDFYGQAVSSAMRAQVNNDNFIGTLNLAKVYNSGVGASAPRASLTKSGVTLPKSGTTAAFAITMRVYYDGALIQTGVANNDHAVYTACTSGEQAAANLLYYSDINGTAIVPTEEDDDVTGLYKVDLSASTLCYARSINVAQIAQQEIKVTFTAA